MERENDNEPEVAPIAIEQENPEEIAERHPLLLPPIIDRICDHLGCDLNQLKVLRLICRPWRKATLSRWRKAGVLTLVQDPPLPFPTQGNGMLFSEFIQNLETETSLIEFNSVPFESYKLRHFLVDVHNSFESPETTRFWEQIGPQMRYLQFDKCEFLAAGEDDIAKMLVQQAPNLNMLALENVSINVLPPDNPDKYFKWKLEEGMLKIDRLAVGENVKLELSTLFNFTPELQVISGLKITEERVILPTLLDDIRGALLRGKPLPRLKELDMLHSGVIEIERGHNRLIERRWTNALADLAAQKFSLVKLSADMTVGTLPHPEDGFNYFLQFRLGFWPNMSEFLGAPSQAATLKTLELFRPPVLLPYYFYREVMHMPTVLTELSLWGTIMPNFDFLVLTPKLQKLFISLGCYGKRTEIIREIQRHGRRYSKNDTDMVTASDSWNDNLILPDLVYFHVDFAFKPKNLEKLAKRMPNLKELQTILVPGNIPVVYEHWKDLKTLVCLPGSNLDDQSIIGRNGVPGLASLDELEKFTLYSTRGPYYVLTNAAIEKGFVRMPNLKSVTLCCNHQINAEGENMLKGHVRHQNIVLHVNGQHNDPDCECCKHEEFFQEFNQ